MADILKPINVLVRRMNNLANKNYTKNKLKKRIGKCNKCAECCKGCRHLDKNTKLCKIYKTRNFMCYKEFPLDDLDKKIWNVKDCGYKFKK
jgi:hypothetical protein